MRKGFTLVEILITLGIIGIVAAITIPSLINKCRVTIMKNQFKKAVATANLAIRQAKAEADIDTFATYCTAYNGIYMNTAECTNALDRVLAVPTRRHATNYEVKTYTGDQRVTISKIGGIAGTCILSPTVRSDGTSICYTINEFRLNFVIDINGYTKPNRLGHDIFYFYVNTNDALTTPKPINYTKEEIEKANNNDLNKNRMGYPCSLTSNQGANGIGCGYYALQDKCPNNTGKSYFDCLPK